MRMGNERDQALVRSAVSDAAANLLAFVPSLGTREVIAFGEGVPLPTRLVLRELAGRAHSQGGGRSPTSPTNSTSISGDAFIDAVIEKWRGSSMTVGPKSEPADREKDGIAERLGALHSAFAKDPARPSILRRPI